MRRTTKLAPTRRPGQFFKGAWQHLSVALLVMMLTAQTAWAQSAIGSIQYNTTGNYYEISSSDNLNDLAVYVNGAGTYSTGGNPETTAHNCVGLKFKMTGNIKYSHKADNADGAATENNYTTIGFFTSDGPINRYFEGHFDGQGHTVSGIRIYKGGQGKTDNNQGIFGQTYDAEIRGVTLTDTRITGYSQTGGIAGYNTGSGILSHNLAIGAVVPAATKYNSHGAICGLNDGILENNYYHACSVASNNITASGVGCGYISDGNDGNTTADITEKNGAVPGIILYDKSSKTGINSNILTTVGNVAVPRVALAGRTLYRDGEWNTLCLPFDVNIAGSVLEGADVRALERL